MENAVRRYRFQIASDENFTDVFFDGLVSGDEYVVKDLSPGRYYWRVAPAEQETGQFRAPVPLEVSATVAKKPVIRNVSTKRQLTVPGWLTTTGEIMRPLAVQLRKGSATDFLGVNAEGTVYALDGVRGTALWIGRYGFEGGVKGESTPQNHFVPLIVKGKSGSAEVVVATARGVRALDGTTGRELWHREIPTGASHGLVVDNGLRGKAAIYLAAVQRNFFVLNAETGQVQTQTKLKDEAIAQPLLLVSKEQRAVLIPVRGALLEVRDLNGDYKRSLRAESDITTSPVLVETAQGQLIAVGTKTGIATFHAADFRPGTHTTLANGEQPVGALSVVDLNRDKISEVVTMTNKGRVVAVDISEGKIKWSSEAYNEAAVAAFADVDGDGQTDVLLPGKNTFAIALSGVDGSVIWQSKMKVAGGLTNNSQIGSRSLAAATIGDGRLIVVGNDRSFMGLRAEEVQQPPKSSVP